MALNLADSQHVQIRDMTLNNCPAEIADVVGCIKRSVFAISHTFTILAPRKRRRMVPDDPEALHLQC